MKRRTASTFVMLYVAVIATAFEARTASAVDQMPTGSAAQESSRAGTITGQVIEAGTSRPLVGARVSIAGTSIGAVSSGEGRFTLTNVPTGSVTVGVQLLGYATAEQTATIRDGETATLDFVLTEQAIALDEVVVTALGIEREAYTLGFATQTVGAEDLSLSRSGNWVNTLQSQVAGLNLQSAASGVIGTTRITLRGENTLDLGRNEALIVVDGIPINNRASGTGASSYLGDEVPIDYGDGISDLNPDDIESVTVLKGPNAAALYGSTASNGAIIITTKTAPGQRSGIGITYSGGLALDRITRWPDYQTEYGSGSRTRSSTLPDDNNSYFYPSASLSLLPSELFDMGRAIDFAKLRLAISRVGNAADPYRLDKYYSFHEFDGSLSNPSTIPNQDLKPEIVTSYEVGFDVRLLPGRLNLDATAYHSESVNQIINVPIDPSTGFASALLNAVRARWAARRGE